jgi:hypothetical protein
MVIKTADPIYLFFLGLPVIDIPLFPIREYKMNPNMGVVAIIKNTQIQGFIPRYKQSL